MRNALQEAYTMNVAIIMHEISFQILIDYFYKSFGIPFIPSFITIHLSVSTTLIHTCLIAPLVRRDPQSCRIVHSEYPSRQLTVVSVFAIIAFLINLLSFLLTDLLLRL